MKWSLANRQTRLYFIGIVILLVGLGSATPIYLTAKKDAGREAMYEFKHSKRYRHDLEVYGGKMSVLTDEWLHWLDTVSHGKPLAVTIAILTGLVSLGFFYAAYRSPSFISQLERDHDGKIPWN